MTRHLFPLVVLFAACGGSAATPTRLEYCLSADPPSLDPALSTDVQSGEVVTLLFDNLVQLDQDAKLRPGLASRWESDSAGRRYTFHLRDGASFHDGRPIARLQAELHLDDPVPAQFARYVGGLIRGDVGTSYITRRPILQDLLQRWVGLILILVIAVTLRWFPPSGSGGLAFLVLPALTLGMRSVAFLSRMTRAAMQEVLESDFICTARAKGLWESRVVLGHGFRNALVPVVTVLGLDFGSYLTGSILTETIFSWPGVGRNVLTAIDKRDLPAIQGSILFLSLVFVMVNLVTDLVYPKADPRVAYD